MLLNIALLLAAYVFMEYVAWFTHKHIMHGFLWRWHKDHHRKDHQANLPEQTEKGWFEKNDLFFLVFATPAIFAMIFGITFQIWALVYISIGITLYGFTYFVFHDIIMHKRLNISRLSNIKNRYVRALIKAHTGHHNAKSKADFSSFGLLVFPKRYLKE